MIATIADPGATLREIDVALRARWPARTPERALVDKARTVLEALRAAVVGCG